MIHAGAENQGLGCEIGTFTLMERVPSLAIVERRTFVEPLHVALATMSPPIIIVHHGFEP